MCADAIQPATPNWDTLDIELICPRCGYNLRMLTVPRCPECGLEFEWEELIAATQMRPESPLFEYHWRDRPIRSFFDTLGRCLVPWKVWTTTSLAVPPRVGPLLAMFVLVVVVRIVGYVVTGLLTFTAVHVIYPWRIRQFGWLWYVDCTWWEIRADLPGVRSFVVIAAALFLSMQIYRQTLARAMIRRTHLFRIAVLCWTTLVLWRVVGEFLSACLHLALVLAGGAWNDPPLLGSTVELLSILALGVALATAFARYLQLKRGWAMAMMSCTLLVLALLAATVYTSSQVYGYVLNGYQYNPVVDLLAGGWPRTVWMCVRLGS